MILGDIWESMGVPSFFETSDTPSRELKLNTFLSRGTPQILQPQVCIAGVEVAFCTPKKWHPSEVLLIKAFLLFPQDWGWWRWNIQNVYLRMTITMHIDHSLSRMIQVSFLPVPIISLGFFLFSSNWRFCRIFSRHGIWDFHWWIFWGQNYWHQVSPYKSSTEVTPVALQPILHSDCRGESISMYHVVQSTQGLQHTACHNGKVQSEWVFMSFLATNQESQPGFYTPTVPSFNGTPSSLCIGLHLRISHRCDDLGSMDSTPQNHPPFSRQNQTNPRNNSKERKAKKEFSRHASCINQTAE